MPDLPSFYHPPLASSISLEANFGLIFTETHLTTPLGRCPLPCQSLGEVRVPLISPVASQQLTSCPTPPGHRTAPQGKQAPTACRCLHCSPPPPSASSPSTSATTPASLSKCVCGMRAALAHPGCSPRCVRLAAHACRSPPSALTLCSCWHASASLYLRTSTSQYVYL